MEHLKQQANSKRKLKLGDIAEHLQVKKFIVRTWEKELGLAPQSGGYDADGVELFKKIKQLVVVEQQSLDHVRQIIGASKISSTIQPAMFEHKDKEYIVTNNLEMAPIEEITEVEEQLCSALVCPTIRETEVEIAAAIAVVENTPLEQEYVLAEVLQASQENTPLMTQATTSNQQQFFAELEFFKQELIRLQALLKI